MVEICMTLYSRVERITEIFDNLLKQTDQDFRINIFNNTDKLIEKDKRFDQSRISIINFSGYNIGPSCRFWVARMSKGNPIIFIDDDQILDDDFVEYHKAEFNKWGKDCILGHHTRRFIDGKYGRTQGKIPYGTRVDYIGTHGMVLDRNIIDTEDSLFNLEGGFKETCEDMYLCFLAKKRGIKLIRIERKVKQINDGRDQCLVVGKKKSGLLQILINSGYPLEKDL